MLFFRHGKTNTATKAAGNSEKTNTKANCWHKYYLSTGETTSTKYLPTGETTSTKYQKTRR
jgi:hypothetical protein